MVEATHRSDLVSFLYFKPRLGAGIRSFIVTTRSQTKVECRVISSHRRIRALPCPTLSRARTHSQYTALSLRRSCFPCNVHSNIQASPIISHPSVHPIQCFIPQSNVRVQNSSPPLACSRSQLPRKFSRAEATGLGWSTKVIGIQVSIRRERQRYTCL